MPDMTWWDGSKGCETDGLGDVFTTIERMALTTYESEEEESAALYAQFLMSAS